MSEIVLSDFQEKEAVLPKLSLRSVSLKNFKVYNENNFVFNDKFNCLYGPNGCGKTTILDAVQLIFSRLEGYEKQRLTDYLSRSLRQDKSLCKSNDFKIEADIESDFGDYSVVLTKDGFIKDHPDEIKPLLYRVCFYTRYDQELNTFQLPREKWHVFKKLFESITGFETIEDSDTFSDSEDPVQAEMLKKYVQGFKVVKPDETISYKSCSAGEKKIMKSFSTLLKKESTPKIILVDNIEMHIELSRHIRLIDSIKECFSDSQIFSTTHSYRISRNYPNKKELYDLRLLKCNDLVKKQPWRLYLGDEIEDALAKLKSLEKNKKVSKTIDTGEGLLRDCGEKISVRKLQWQVSHFLGITKNLFVEDTIKRHKNDG